MLRLLALDGFGRAGGGGGGSMIAWLSSRADMTSIDHGVEALGCGTGPGR